MMSDPALGLLMLALIVVVIIMGFPTAFTLMGLGMFFGFIAFYIPGQTWTDNRVFELMVQRTYGAMTNDVLISIPLFVLMGYVMERGALVDKMFYSIQLAFRNVPASLAVATLIVCTFWGIASGLVGAVVVLMGVIAFNPMLKAGYDVKLASGVITAGGTLGILIPPSVMIIVYAAVAGQSVVKLYAAAMFPGFFLALLYLVYILGWAMINPKIAPKLPEEKTKVPVPDWMRKLEAAYSSNIFVALIRAMISPKKASQFDVDGRPLGRFRLFVNFLYSLVPATIIAGTLATVWWYVVIHQQRNAEEALPEGLQPLGNQAQVALTPAEMGPGSTFYIWFAVICALAAIIMIRYYWRMNADRLEVIKLLSSSTMPLGILTVVVLAVILFGITTATESAAVGAAGAFLLAFHARTLDYGVLAVRRLGAVLGGVRDPRRSGAARAMGARAQHDADPVHDPVDGDHLRARMAAGMDRDHRDLRADLPAHAETLQHRSDPVGHAGLRELAGGVPVTARGDVGLLSEGCRAQARHAEPDFLRHDALHDHRHHLHGHHVSLARNDAVAAQLSLWRPDLSLR
jgi:TRAP-type mannitol/chloroaromatic compound transport system permease large subunit